jgi:glycosyltransferase involved in cell wall biosynthesis
MPKVSIIVPIYNVEKYLRECLDSIVKQTLKDIEIVCVNDGSTDSSLDIIKEYAEKDERVKYIDKPNSGYGISMNQGLDKAQGEYIGIVESDDFIKPEMFEELYNLALVGYCGNLSASLILAVVVVGSERNASQVAVSIIGNISRNRIDRHSLEDSLHGLLSIHRNSGGSFRAHLSTCGVLPFLELIAEVLGGLQCHLRTFLI